MVCADSEHTQLIHSNVGVLKLFAPCFSLVDEVLARGNNVLIHCLAGAHRAGTTSVAYLMHRSELEHGLARLDVAQAMAVAKRRRPIIDPLGEFDGVEQAGIRP